MHISLVGINHRTAPIAIRERAAVRAGKLDDALSLLQTYISQGVILSTCNRTEVYTVHSDGQYAKETSLNFLKAHLDIADADLLRYAYVSNDGAVATHLFRVASGLDSMLIGEFEVLGQVKQALAVAEKAKMVNLPLRHLFQSAIRAGRRVREETGISKNALSVGSVAVDLAAKVVGNLTGSKMLVIGAGEAGGLVAKAARDRGISSILVASRTQERASALATTLGGTPIALENLAEELNTCDIVVACADAPHWILGVHQVEAAMRNRHQLPLVIIDIAIPRNVEPAVAQINNVSLYNIDNLTYISDLNRRQREEEIQKAEKMITDGVAKFTSWWQEFEVRPIVSALMKKAEDIRSYQLNKTLKKLPSVSDEERYRLEMLTKSIVTRLLQEPISLLKEGANGGSDSAQDYAQMVRELFHLNVRH